MKQVFFSLAALVGVGLVAAPVMAQTPGQVNPTQFGTQVKLTVAETVSIWADPVIELELKGANAENSDIKVGQIFHINNVRAQVRVQLHGPLPSGTNFWIFNDEVTPADANNYLVAGAGHSPANGIHRWQAGEQGRPAEDFMIVNAAHSVATKNVIYAADARNSLPDAMVRDLVVTWTIIPAP